MPFYFDVVGYVKLSVVCAFTSAYHSRHKYLSYININENSITQLANDTVDLITGISLYDKL